MDSTSVRQRMDDFEATCRAEGMPVTVQRRIVLESLLMREDHPTVDQLHVSVEQRLGGVSRATVYRTLETLAQMGVISKACHPGAVARYDGRAEPHHHLVCLSCGDVTDFEDERLDALPLPSVEARGFKLQELRVQLRGTCQTCIENKEPKN